MVMHIKVCLAVITVLMPLQTSGLTAGNRLVFRLQAQVATICEIADVEYAPAATDTLVIRTNCNAERYTILLPNQISDVIIGEASIASGRLTRSGERLQVLSERPGFNELRLRLASPPPGVEPSGLTILAV